LGASFARELEAKGKSYATVAARVTAARTLYAALRWPGATQADPFRDVKLSRDPTPRWEKRSPYRLADVERLVAAAAPRDAVLVLLGAHAGLRVSEACALEWSDVDLCGGELRVKSGKGGKARTAPLSGRLTATLAALQNGPGRVLGISPRGARKALERLTKRAGVPYLGVHSLRLSSGTRLYRDTGDLETVARHLGHSTLETSRIYAKWSDDKLRRTVASW
jgi:integrase